MFFFWYDSLLTSLYGIRYSTNIAQKTDCSFYLINISDNVEIEHFLNFLLPYTLTLTFHAITRNTINIIESDLYVNLYYIPETCLTLTLLPIFELNIPSSNCLTAIWRSVTLTPKAASTTNPERKSGSVAWRVSFPETTESGTENKRAVYTRISCREPSLEETPSFTILISRPSRGDHRPLAYCYLRLTGFWHASGPNVLI